MAEELVVDLHEAAELGTDKVGSKAANLARLVQAGLRVPPALVITTNAVARRPEIKEQLFARLDQLGGTHFAVRSSAVAEDLGGASYAGQYESYLNIGRDGLEAAIEACWESASSSRVAAYEESRSESSRAQHPAMAVIVQKLVCADAAGVAFSANPVTGNRREVVVTAVRGLGERLVSGEAIGDEWIVGDSGARATRTPEHAIGAKQAAAVAELARRVASAFAEPIDIEWALESEQLYLLQARPMTALPEAVEWAAPVPGYWIRNFRIGEWLHEPMTPLFRTWLLEQLEAGYLDVERQMAGSTIAFPHAAINGWYYTALPRFGPRLVGRALAESRLRLVPFLINVLVRISSNPEAADRAVLRRLYEGWRDRFLPEYRDLVAGGEKRLNAATEPDLLEMIDQVGKKAGGYLAYLAVVGGSAWKMEGCLARFFRQHLAADVDGSVQVLLSGLPGSTQAVPPHAVLSLDWFWPTAGEMGWERDAAAGLAVRERLAAERVGMESACRAALARRPHLLARFETLLEVCQRYAAIREEQATELTLGWPLLRHAALRLGEHLQSSGRLEEAEDVFFLTRPELESDSPYQEVVARRRNEWERQRQLVAPLTIGSPPRTLFAAVKGAVDAARTTADVPEGAIVGEPASPGRASGRVRIVGGPADFDRFQSGEVLVAETTAPAWTPLFAKAVAVVTDGGTLAAHASLVAREYGIPAVVATGDAMARLSTGQTVIVDGGAGLVIPG